MKKEFINWLVEKKVIVSGKKFITKSGMEFDYETDIRYAMKNYEDAYKTSEYIYNLMDVKEFDCFVGVPETGTLIANFLNHIKYSKLNENFDINMIRAVNKNYQTSTNSIKTVLPLDRKLKVCIIEDDVVTGNSIIKCIRNITNSNIEIVNVVSVIDRDISYIEGKTLKEYLKDFYKINYYNILNFENIKEFCEGELTHG